MAETYDGQQINAVLTLVERMTQNGDVQLSLLAHALVIACKSTKVDRDTMMDEIDKLWDRWPNTPAGSANSRCSTNTPTTRLLPNITGALF